MKRIISILTIFFLLGSMLFVRAAETNAQEVSKCEAAKFLEFMQILPEKADAVYTQSVSRGDFAVALASLLKINGEDYENVRYFTDLASYDYAYGSINGLVERGIISGADDYLFHPEREITLNEAVKMLVCALGYRSVAEANGGYPTGYAYAAKDIDLTDNVSAKFTDNITLNDTAQLLFNSLISPVYKITDAREIGDNTYYSYTEESENGLIYTLYGMRAICGVVTGSNGINISLDTTSDESSAVIAGEVFDLAEGVEFIDLIGVDVYGIYEDDTNNLIYAFPTYSGDSEIEVIDIDDFVSYTDEELCYTKAGSNKVLKADIADALLLYNGAVPGENIAYLMSEENLVNGNIRLIDIEDNGSYDAVMVENYESFLFKYADTTNNVLYCLTENESISLSGYDYVSITDESGADVAIEDITPKTVLNVSRTQDNDRVKIIVSEKTAEGIISAVNEIDGEIYVTVDGADFKVSRQHKNRIASSVVTGKNALLCLDMFDNIVEIETISPDGYSVAYIIRAGEDEDGGMRIRSFTSDGELKVLKCAENMRVDGRNYRGKSLEAVLSIPTATGNEASVKFTPQIIRYKTNDKGEITVIDTYDTGTESSNETLTRTLDGTTSVMKFADRLGKTELISSTNTKVYHVPFDDDVDSAEESDFLITGVNRINTRYSFVLEAYKLRGENEHIDVIVFRRTTTDTEQNDWWNSNMFLVSKTVNAVDEEGNYFTEIRGMVNGAGTSIRVYPDNLSSDSVQVENINEGDLIRYRTNIHGKIHDIEKLYDPEGYDFSNWKNFSTTNSLFDNTYDQYFQLSYGFVSEKKENSLGWGYKSGDVTDERADLTAFKVMIYDSSQKSGNRVYTTKFSAANAYEDVGDTCDKIIVQLGLGTVKGVVLYR